MSSRRMQQIRVLVSKESYNILKKKSEEIGLDLRQYAGIILSGFEIRDLRLKELESNNDVNKNITG